MALQTQLFIVIFQICFIFISSNMHVTVSSLEPKCSVGKQCCWWQQDCTNWIIDQNLKRGQ